MLMSICSLGERARYKSHYQKCVTYHQSILADRSQVLPQINLFKTNKLGAKNLLRFPEP